MRRRNAALAFCLLVGFVSTGGDLSASAPADAEVEARLADLHLRAGSPPDLRRRDVALAWLLDHAERAFPLVLARAQAQPADLALLDLLSRYRRGEATPILLRAFADPDTRLQAASGLGMSPDPAAHAALLAALSSPDTDESVAALSGLGAGGDPASCGDIVPILHADAAELRWMAVEVGARLNCIDKATLEAISREDPDATVRALAAAKLG